MSDLPENAGILANLPADLHYLVEPVLRCGCPTEWAAFDYLDNATAAQLEELASIAERVLQNSHYPAVNQFLDQYEMTEHEECAKLYFFFGLLDHGGFVFDRATEEQ